MMSKTFNLFFAMGLVSFLFLPSLLLADDISYKMVDMDGKSILAKKMAIFQRKITYDANKSINKDRVTSITVLNGKCDYRIKELEMDFSKPSMKLSFDLVDGSHFEDVDLIFDKKSYSFAWHDNKIKLKDTSIRSFILKPERIKEVKQWHRWLKQTTFLKDKLMIEKGQAVVTVEGVFVRFDFEEQKIVFLWNDKERKISIDKVVGIILASKLIKRKEAFTLHHTTIYGHEIVLDKNKIFIKFLDNQYLKFSVGCISKISLSIVELEYLSNLKPLEVESAGILIENVKGFRNDKSIWNNPLTIGKKSFKRGLGVHAKSVLKYAIPENARKFKSSIGIDGEVKNYGGCLFKILIDDKEVFSQEVNAKDKEYRVDLDVENKKEITLIVLPGKNLDVGDHGTWGDAKFVLK